MPGSLKAGRPEKAIIGVTKFLALSNGSDLQCRHDFLWLRCPRHSGYVPDPEPFPKSCIISWRSALDRGTTDRRGDSAR